ncbi:MAG: DUF721 domain-containing protein [Candidatus Alcyoniella australis]|nr:DUF721 domain-containing protein [Candidatus Alcyoniella australis]
MRDYTPHNRRTDPAGKLVIEALEALGLGKGLKRYGVLADWESIVGPGLARRCRPAGYKGDKLVVAVHGGSVWQHQLYLMRSQILDKINRVVAPEHVEEIRIEPMGRPEEYELPRRHFPPPPQLEGLPIDREQLQSLLADSGLEPDDPLRKALERYLRHSMQLKHWRAEQLDPEQAP